MCDTGRFQWAVCQLDLLRRKQAEPQAIERCLGNLPQTVFETYKEIFESIEETHWPAVRTTLRWIYLHRELYSRAIPAEVLVQAVCREASKYSDDNFYDEHELREIMGYLLRISTDEPFHTELHREDKDQDQIRCPVASFAHYTVFEFLTDRLLDNRQASLRSFKLSRDALVQPISTLLEVAADSTSYTYENLRPRRDGMHLVNSLSGYSVVSSLIAITLFPSELATRSDVLPQIWKLLEPTEEHFRKFLTIYSKAQNDWSIQTEAGLQYLGPTEVQWLRRPRPTSRHASLLHLTRLTQAEPFYHSSSQRNPDMSSLVRATVGEMVAKKSAADTAEFVAQADFLSNRRRFRFCGSLNSTFLEAYVLFNFDVHPNDKVLTTVNWEGIDYAKILVFGVCSSLFVDLTLDGTDYNYGDRHLPQILKNVKPDSKAFGVSALQVAAALCDYRAIELLLDGGADVNSVSNSVEMAWSQDSPLAILNFLRGKSPLHLCETENAFAGRLAMMGQRKEINKQRVTRLLRDQEARSFDERVDKLGLQHYLALDKNDVEFDSTEDDEEWQ